MAYYAPRKQPTALLVFDFETCGTLSRSNGKLDAHLVEPIQIACLALDVGSLKEIPGSRFNSMMRATSKDVIQAGALKVNKKTVEEIMAAPDREVVWKRFTEHVKKFNPSGSVYTAPIPCGKNIKGFDLAIVDFLCSEYGPCDKNNNQTLFNNRTLLDIEDDLWRFFAHRPDELPDMKMDTVRTYFGMSNENGHDALQDCEDTGRFVTKFVKLYREMGQRVKFRNAMRTEEVEAE